jgi:hypothetical protein
MNPTDIPMGMVNDSGVTLGRVVKRILPDIYQRTS